MLQFHTNRKNSCSTEDVLTTCKRSSGQDSSLKDEKVNKVGRRSSSRHSIHLVQIQTKKNSAAIYPTRRMYTTKDQCSPSTRQRIAILADDSHAIIVCSSVPADSISKVISQRGEKTLFERLSTPRPAPKIVLKSNWQSQQQQQPNTLEGPTSAGIGKPLRGLQPSTSTIALTPVSIGTPLREGFEPTEEKEEPEFEVDLRIEWIAQDAILKDEERTGKIKEVMGKLRIGSQPKGKSN